MISKEYKVTKETGTVEQVESDHTLTFTNTSRQQL